MPTPPVADLNYVTLHGRYLDFTGSPIGGTITFTPSVTLLDAASDTILIPTAFSATIDNVTGMFSIDLPATDDPDISPTGWTYAVVENITKGRSYAIQVPINAPVGGWSLVALAPAPPSTGAFNYVLLTNHKLSSLTDVNFPTAPTNGETLVYDAASSTWRPGSAASGVSKGTLASRPAATGSGAAYYATDTGQLFVDIAIGQWSSAPGADITDFVYGPAGGATYTTSSATFAAIDATNLVFTFVAPDSGVVWIDWTSYAKVQNADMQWGFLEGATQVALTQAAYGVANNMQITCRFRIAGLTPGTTHTYKLAWNVDTAGQVATLFAHAADPVLIRVTPGK